MKKFVFPRQEFQKLLKGLQEHHPNRKRYFSIFRSLINNSIQLARATELALPIIATTNIDNNIMLDSI
ncbi:hypothetical protein H04402_01684 [Clostridium botulinum H04402 065]|nr:hypothetical protein H04402_01684 [Clostridium botulinum H04402 065]